MKDYLFLKFLKVSLKEYIFIFLTAIIFLFFSFTSSQSEENVFTINNVKVEGAIDINFSREKYLNRAFSNSFEILMNKILLTRDLKKVSKLNLVEIKKLIRSFKILEENYSKNEYKANFKITFNDKKVKKFLANKNISFSQPENISAVFYPILYVNNDIQDFNRNFFYKNWLEVKIKNELINFILPLEDLEDISNITKMKNRIEDLNINNLVNKYDIKNYVFAFMDYQNAKLNIYIKTNFKGNQISKNIFYDIKNIEDELALNLILKDLKLIITDIWKEENLLNLLMPLTIEVKFSHENIKNLDKLRNIFQKVSMIDQYELEEFNINNSFFKIYYYGNPKKLSSELFKFGYRLENNQGYWEIYLNE